MEVRVIKNTSFPVDLNTVFSEDDKFLGTFECKEYRLTRKFIEGKGIAMRLYYNHMEPIVKPKKATLIIVHGFGEHSGKFLDFGEFFVLQGFDVHFIDLRGFGYSGGARGVSVIEDMIADIEMCMRQVQEGLPLFLFGHSLGGLLVTSLGARNPHIKIAGIIANAPLLGLPKDRNIDIFKMFTLKLVGDFLGDIVANSMINLTALTQNDRFLRTALEDKLMIPFLGAKMAKSMLWAIEMIQQQAKEFKFPIFVMHGNSDFVTNHLDSINFYENCSSNDKKIKLFEGGYHQMQHDHQVGEIQKLIVEWMDERVPHSVKFDKNFKVTYKSHLQDNFARSIKRNIMIAVALVVYLILLKKILQKFPSAPLLQKILFPLFYSTLKNLKQ
ncbi:alpha/beta fold hydrolase (macronuclear) [Tetrahymena thermophila SB210]|uniref:Alpha/beta fold hydrolase n=1 Tax=Tetrahymena thermophila (strain SB210) TaxID=312017 RepID=I7M806_TETTS|nr:alpha/beta fold hydrolase [Tetrahymena thermophila SB210]EAR96376.2 alpha/beta fold hydrolase [Tetrahymena thermophila SB210]|eukprot:XP_001016621.2 alpha/beta fold hydrolase [Tetrahymena thermophila SB210]